MAVDGGSCTNDGAGLTRVAYAGSVSLRGWWMEDGQGPWGLTAAGGRVTVGNGCLGRRWRLARVVSVVLCTRLGPNGPILLN
jgi:hypothetical protein